MDDTTTQQPGDLDRQAQYYEGLLADLRTRHAREMEVLRLTHKIDLYSAEDRLRKNTKHFSGFIQILIGRIFKDRKVTDG